MRNIFYVFIVVLFLISGQHSFGRILSPFPIALFYPNLVGLLYPGYLVSGGVNPASIPTTGKGLAFEADIGSNPTLGYLGTAFTSGLIGMNAGAYSTFSTQPSFQSGFIGLGVNFDIITLGVNFRDTSLSNQAYDVGFTFQNEMSPIDFGFVLHNINDNPSTQIGIGTRQGRHYNLEFNVLLPPFNNFNNNFNFLVSANMNAEWIFFYFKVTYATLFNSTNMTGGLGFEPSENLQINFEFNNPNELIVGLHIML